MNDSMLLTLWLDQISRTNRRAEQTRTMIDRSQRQEMAIASEQVAAASVPDSAPRSDARGVSRTEQSFPAGTAPSHS